MRHRKGRAITDQAAPTCRPHPRYRNATGQGSAAGKASGDGWLDPAQSQDIDIDRVKTGDLLVIRAGERIPLDGVVLAGEASVDESMITGESVLARRGVGEPLTGATIMQQGNVVMKVTRTGEDTVLSQIIALVARAQATKAPVQRLADRIRPRVRPRGDYRRIVDRCHMDNVRAATQTSPCAGDGGQRIDHRVSLRARTGHAAIGDRGDRPRRHERRAGHIRQGLGAGPRHPNRRVRQDRDDHRRSHR